MGMLRQWGWWYDFWVMRVAERATPVAAAIAALSTLTCCLPLGFLGAVGLAGLSTWAQSFRSWFLAISAVLLVVGFVQLYRGHNRCKKRSLFSIVLFWVAAVIVLLIVVFPQVIANLLAG
jgi:cytochrome bd-type quinol oxidase subunit 2